MSPHEMSRIRPEFDRAIARLGWRRSEVAVHHERDWNSVRTVVVYLGPSGSQLFDENDISEAMAREIIRIADLMPDLGTE